MAAHPPAEALVVGARGAVMRSRCKRCDFRHGGRRRGTAAYCEAAGVASAGTMFRTRSFRHCSDAAQSVRPPRPEVPWPPTVRRRARPSCGFKARVDEGGPQLLRDWFREPLTKKCYRSAATCGEGSRDDQVDVFKAARRFTTKRSGDKLAKGRRRARSARAARVVEAPRAADGARAVADAPENVSSLPKALAMSEASGVRKDVLAKTNAALERRRGRLRE